ncbi:hypothetical protein NPIL_277291 [Nephila pilipes]|uniref:Uncharacterized protein n=1 Tax=Nephila pilipes TaxID=299642 RepID=A0A8X6TRG1_NEPPI|nr:hypothetical protein NPIL_277291 [Nephila pilipes]
MSIIGKLKKKDELTLFAEELGLMIPEGAKLVDLRNIIENCDLCINDIGFVQNIVGYVIEEKKSTKEREIMKLESEKIKLAQLQQQSDLLEKELQLENFKKETRRDKLTVIDTLNRSTENLINTSINNSRD